MSVILKKSNIFKVKPFYKYIQSNHKLSTKNEIKNIPEKEIKKSVFISQSNDIFVNLALEDWFYRNYDFSKHHILLLWKNNPCVVFGRHQNPWVECNIPAAEGNGIKLARRNSGGGTVYHDFGNLNLSFFTPRERYNRRYNLDIIVRALYREWGIETTINKKEDIIVQDNFKISGTAAKLGRPNAYHHCTLLVDANKSLLHAALQKIETGITTNATESIRSPVKNLKDVNHHVTTDKLLNAVGWEYLRTKALKVEDGGYNLVQNQRGFQMINPTEDWFPGFENILGEFRSWDWNFGKTPNFTVTRLLTFPKSDGVKYEITLVINVEKGIIKNITMTFPSNNMPYLQEDANVITTLCGKRYSHEIPDKIVAATGCKLVKPLVTDNMSNVAINQ